MDQPELPRAGVRTLTVGVVAQTGVLALRSAAAALPARRHALPALRRAPAALGRRRAVHRVPGRRARPILGVRLRGEPRLGRRRRCSRSRWATPSRGAGSWSTAWARTSSRRSTCRSSGWRSRADVGCAGRQRGPRASCGSRGATATSTSSPIPRRGFVIRPRLEMTTPGAFNTSEYVLADLGGTAFLPLTDRDRLRAARRRGPHLALRRQPARGGRVAVPGAAAAPRRHLHDRRHPRRPRLGQPARRAEDPRGAAGRARRTAAAFVRPSGTRRSAGWRGSPAASELRLPLPGFAEAWQTFAFLDGGRVWIPDERFTLGGPDLEQDDFFAAAGGGHQLPDRRRRGAARAGLQAQSRRRSTCARRRTCSTALEEGRPVTDAEARSGRRLHLHFAIGSTF